MIPDEELQRLASDGDYLHVGQLAKELIELRAAKRSDRERIAGMVARAIAAEMCGLTIRCGIDNTSATLFDAERTALFTTIASRVADQLATATVQLSDKERVALVAIRDLVSNEHDKRGHGNDWSRELAIVDRLLGAPK